LAILVLVDAGDIDPIALRRRYYTHGLVRLVAVHQNSTAKMRGMLSLEDLLEQSIVTHLQRAVERFSRTKAHNAF
jgi:hypothetical protein